MIHRRGGGRFEKKRGFKGAFRSERKYSLERFEYPRAGVGARDESVREESVYCCAEA